MSKSDMEKAVEVADAILSRKTYDPNDSASVLARAFREAFAVAAKVGQVTAAVRAYHLALDRRMDAAIAVHLAMRTIEATLEMPWRQGEEDARSGHAHLYSVLPKTYQGIDLATDPLLEDGQMEVWSGNCVVWRGEIAPIVKSLAEVATKVVVSPADHERLRTELANVVPGLAGCRPKVPS